MSDEAKDVKISIEDRINSQLGSVTLDWAGTDIDLDGVTSWIQPDVLGYSARPTRLSNRFEFWTISFNCYARTGAGGETTHKVWELVDMILTAFDQVTMAIKDWSAGDPKPTVAYLRFTEGNVTPITPPAEAGKYVQQLNVAFEALLIV
jgi:hypothetical protein